jgi:hypothetical protein
MKKYISLITTFFFGVMFISEIGLAEGSFLPVITGNQIIADNTTFSAGITPDSFLYPLDVALDQISLLLTFDPGAKARKSLQIARERLLETREMILKNKLKAAERARIEHEKMLKLAQSELKVLNRTNSTQELKETTEIEKEIEEHEVEIEQVMGQAKVKISVEGKLTPEMKQTIDEFMDKMRNLTEDVKLEINNKKLYIKQRLKKRFNLTDKEIEARVIKIERRIGLRKLMKEKAEDKIEDAEEAINETKEKLLEINQTNITIPNVTFVLLHRAENLLSKAKTAFNETKYGEAYGNALSALRLAKDSERLVEKLEETKELKKELRERIAKIIRARRNRIRARIVRGLTKVEIEINGTEAKLVIPTTKLPEIINKISTVTGLDKDTIRKMIKTEIVEEPRKQELPTSALPTPKITIEKEEVEKTSAGVESKTTTSEEENRTETITSITSNLTKTMTK